MTQPVTCSNCGWRGTEEECDDVKFLEGRVAAGEIVPAGECPVCGCLAHLDRVADPHALIAALRSCQDRLGVLIETDNEDRGGAGEDDVAAYDAATKALAKAGA